MGKIGFLRYTVVSEGGGLGYFGVKIFCWFFGLLWPSYMHRGWGKCKLPSGKANKDSKSKPILTQNANFTLLFAILHEIPIAPKRPLSRWEMLSPNDFLGQNWIFEARKGCVFFEKSCPKLTILLQNDPFSHLTPGSWCTQGKRSTHYKWRTRFEWRTRKPASSHKPTPASHPLAPWSPWGGDHRSQVLCSWDIWT